MPGSHLVVLPSGETADRAGVVKLSSKEIKVYVYVSLKKVKFSIPGRLAEDDDIMLG